MAIEENVRRNHGCWRGSEKRHGVAQPGINGGWRWRMAGNNGNG
jgi:hypothetical protein